MYTNLPGRLPGESAGGSGAGYPEGRQLRMDGAVRGRPPLMYFS